jgi:hypothetical protein
MPLSETHYTPHASNRRKFFPAISRVIRAAHPYIRGFA